MACCIPSYFCLLLLTDSYRNNQIQSLGRQNLLPSSHLPYLLQRPWFRWVGGPLAGRIIWRCWSLARLSQIGNLCSRRRSDEGRLRCRCCLPMKSICLRYLLFEWPIETWYPKYVESSPRDLLRSRARQGGTRPSRCLFLSQQYIV